MTGRRSIVAGAMALAAALAGCGFDTGDDEEPAEEAEEGPAELYGVADDYSLWRWEVGAESAEPVLDLGGVWEREGDVGTVLHSSLTVDPTGHRAAWIAGGDTDAQLMVGDLETGETEAVASYPLDHACLDPTWLPDGSAVMAHRAEVWGDTGGLTEAFGPVEWFAEQGDPPPETALGEGCRLRWYTDGGELRGLYRDLAVDELYRVGPAGEQLVTIGIDSLDGVDAEATDLVDVDPTGRFVCLTDGYDEHDDYEGGFTIRPETGTNVIDLESGESVGAACETLTAHGYLTHAASTVKLIDYQGVVLWEASLPAELVNAPNLFYVP
ncbi:hypothetical protein GCM10027447_31630 [Glycomyces halotolerans]